MLQRCIAIVGVGSAIYVWDRSARGHWPCVQQPPWSSRHLRTLAITAGVIHSFSLPASHSDVQAAFWPEGAVRVGFLYDVKMLFVVFYIWATSFLAMSMWTKNGLLCAPFADGSERIWNFESRTFYWLSSSSNTFKRDRCIICLSSRGFTQRCRPQSSYGWTEAPGGLLCRETLPSWVRLRGGSHS